MFIFLYTAGIQQESVSGAYIQIQRIRQESNRNSMRLCLDGTNITSLPDITGVTYLKCNNNRLKVLSDMPNMEELYCRNNKLRLLPYLPNVKKLSCFTNRIKRLSYFPFLTDLWCKDNKVKDFSRSRHMYGKNKYLQKLNPIFLL